MKATHVPVGGTAELQDEERPSRVLADNRRFSGPASVRNSLLPGSTPRAAAGAPELLSHSATELVAVAGDCVIVVITKTLSPIGVSAVQRGFEQVKASHEEVGYLSYVEGAACGAMDATARNLMADVVRRNTSRIGAAAIVVNGDGFRSTVVRSVITGIHLASRAAHPMRVFPKLAPALDWYAAQRPRRQVPVIALREALFELYPPARAAQQL